MLIETGLRIGEVLGIFMEGFVFDHANGHKIRLVDRGEIEKCTTLFRMVRTTAHHTQKNNLI